MPELWQWEEEVPRATPTSGPQFVAQALRQLDGSPLARVRLAVAELPDRFHRVAGLPLREKLRRFVRLVPVAGLVVVVAAGVAFGPNGLAGSPQRRLRALEAALLARDGELTNARLVAERLGQIVAQSSRYRIPADLAAAIYDIAMAEGIEPSLAFALVRVESGFVATAVSPAGAVGLTQVMPSTATELEPGLEYRDLFERDTNLRLGLRYLHRLLEQYDGDVRTALLAYNRGPTRVDAIRGRGEDPGNGYARDVMTRARGQ